MNRSIVAVTAVVAFFGAYTAKHALAATALPNYRQWFVPVVLLWVGVAEPLREALDPASGYDAGNSAHLWAIWTAPWAIAAWWRYRVRKKGFRLPHLGNWVRPSRGEAACFLGSAALVAAADLVSKAVLFHGPSSPNAQAKFFVCSAFHHDPLTYYHPMMLSGVFLVACVGGLFFRYRRNALTYAWRVGAGAWVGATIALESERAVYEGVHNVFCVRGAARWLCPTCALRYANEYAFCISDVFVFWPHAMILLVSLIIYASERLRLSARRGPGTLQEATWQADDPRVP